MRVLVFVAESVGLKCLSYLLNEWADDEYSFVVRDADEEAIIGLLRDRGLGFDTYSDDVIDRIAGFHAGHFDWLLNLWSPFILRENVLSRARRSLNIHPAYLPYGRGRDPVVWAIRKGQPAGVALHSIVPAVDSGPIWYREEVPYEMPCKGRELYARVVDRCWRAFCERWPEIRDATAEPIPQEEDSHIHRRRELLEDRTFSIDDDESMRRFVGRLLAHDFAPGYTARLRFDQKLYVATLNLEAVDDGPDG